MHTLTDCAALCENCVLLDAAAGSLRCLVRLLVYQREALRVFVAVSIFGSSVGAGSAPRLRDFLDFHPAGFKAVAWRYCRPPARFRCRPTKHALVSLLCSVPCTVLFSSCPFPRFNRFYTTIVLCPAYPFQLPAGGVGCPWPTQQIPRVSCPSCFVYTVGKRFDDTCIRNRT